MRIIYKALFLSCLLLCTTHFVFAGQSLSFDIFMVDFPFRFSPSLPTDASSGIWHLGFVGEYYTDEHVGKENKLYILWDTSYILGNFESTTLIPGVDTGFYIDGEAAVAKIAGEYYKLGILYPEYSFFSHFVQAGAYIRLKPFDKSYIEVGESLQFSFFSPKDLSSPQFVLPNNFISPKTQLVLKYEGLRDSYDHLDWVSSDSKMIDGFKFYSKIELEFRLNDVTWGGSTLAAPLQDNRNLRDISTPMLTAFFRITAAKDFGGIGIIADVQAGFGFNLDDLGRFRVGGNGNYLPALHGAFFGEFTVDHFISASLEIPFMIGDSLRFKPGLDMLTVNDPNRVGNTDQFGFFYAFSLQMDIYSKTIGSLEIRLGFIPNIFLDQSRFSFLIGLHSINIL